MAASCRSWRTSRRRRRARTRPFEAPRPAHRSSCRRTSRIGACRKAPGTDRRGARRRALPGRTPRRQPRRACARRRSARCRDRLVAARRAGRCQRGGSTRRSRRLKRGFRRACPPAEDDVYSLPCATTIPSTTWSRTAFALSSCRGEPSARSHSAQASRRSCRSGARRQVRRRVRYPHRRRRHRERRRQPARC